MDRFSVSMVPTRVQLYTCSRDVFTTMIVNRYYNIQQDILSISFLENEITLYVNVLDGNGAVHQVLQGICDFDPRVYHVIDIHEDIPGIDHIGIIYRISKRFVEKEIPILYLNTYGHNLVLVSEDHMTKAWDVLQEIAYV